MDVELTREQARLREAARQVAEAHLAAGAAARARTPGHPIDAARALAASGLLGIRVPEAEGGRGLGVTEAILAIETVGRICPRSADLVHEGSFGPVQTLARYGDASLRRRLLPVLLAGETVLGSAITEPEAGTAAADLRTTATPDGQGFRLTGVKRFAGHSADAERFLVYARFGGGGDGIGVALVERDAPGLSTGSPVRYMSGDLWQPLRLDGVYVGPEQVLLRTGGFTAQAAEFDVERLGHTARGLALAGHAFDVARTYAAGRRQFGRLLCEFQGVQWSFAEMHMRLVAARLMLYRAAAAADRGTLAPGDAAAVKAFGTVAAFEVCHAALQAMGAFGYGDETLVEYCLRKARGLMLTGGTVEMLKVKVAEAIFGRRFPQAPSAPGT